MAELHAPSPRLRLSPGLSPSVYLRRPLRTLPFPLGEPDCRLFSHARVALRFALAAQHLGDGAEIIAPAYHCGIEIEVIHCAGVRLRFYDATPDLVPDESELDGLVTASTKALLLIHYFGFPQDSARWRRWCDQRGILLIEDCAQSWLTTQGGVPSGQLADIAIFSLYKSLPIPDGAALTFAAGLHISPLRRSVGLVPTAKRHIAWLMARHRALDDLMDRFTHRSSALDVGRDTSISLATGFLLPRTAGREVIEARRRNYLALLAAFHEHVPVPFRALPDGAVPLVFPLESAQGAVLAGHLQADGVEARTYWERPHPLLDTPRFGGAARWRQRLVAVPVHQELKPGDVQRLANAVRRALQRSSDGRTPQP